MRTPREELAGALKAARLAAGYNSHAMLAKRLHVSRPVVTRAESAAQPCPSDQLLAAWSGATGTDLEPLAELARRARSGTPAWFAPYRAAEAQAQILRSWSPVIVPGPAQAVAYMRALFNDEGHDLADADDLVNVRQERQRVIGRVPATFILSQHVLGRLVGNPAIMTEQMAHLAHLAETPRVAVHVLPDATSMGSYGSFSLATSDAGTTVLMEGLRDITTTEPDLVTTAMVAWERLLGAAMSRDASLEAIRTAEETWKAWTGESQRLAATGARRASKPRRQEMAS